MPVMSLRIFSKYLMFCSHTPFALCPSLRSSKLLYFKSLCSMASSSPSPLAPRSFPTTGFQLLEPSVAIEEEKILNYNAERYYPVHLGEVFNERYQAVAKLGFGASSTVWLCRDLIGRGYVALKVYINNSKSHREFPIYNRLTRIQSDHFGRRGLRTLLDSFEITRPHGKHICLVHEPMGLSLYELKTRAKKVAFPELLLRVSMRQVLRALIYLHDEAHIIHTDVQPNNILMGINDDTVLPKHGQAEVDDPIPRKILKDRTIYMSRPLPLTSGYPRLCDLGEARSGNEEHDDDIMPDVYRAPEVLMGMNWGYPVDVWSVAMTAWDLFEQKSLFSGKTPEGRYDIGYHLAEMVAILGPPPCEFLERSKNSLVFWDENGTWRGLIPIPDTTLDSREGRLTGEDKDHFLQFMRKMLKWLPEERSKAKEALLDPWLMED